MNVKNIIESHPDQTVGFKFASIENARQTMDQLMKLGYARWEPLIPFIKANIPFVIYAFPDKSIGWDYYDSCDRTCLIVDVVDHPSHYAGDKIECIDAMVKEFGKDAVEHFCLLNCFKYLWRFGDKNGDEDIEKAKWYFAKYKELLNSCSGK
jgi:hypothetical protein